MMRSLSAADWNNPNVRFGSLADIVQRPRHVCFTPNSGLVGAGEMSAKCH
jgi:hypothetical protein